MWDVSLGVICQIYDTLILFCELIYVHNAIFTPLSPRTLYCYTWNVFFVYSCLVYRSIRYKPINDAFSPILLDLEYTCYMLTCPFVLVTKNFGNIVCFRLHAFMCPTVQCPLCWCPLELLDDTDEVFPLRDRQEVYEDTASERKNCYIATGSLCRAAIKGSVVLV